MSKVRIPLQLQPLAGGQRAVDVTAETVAGLIEQLENDYPGFKERLLDETGDLRRFVNIYLDDEDIRFQDGLSTKITDEAEVSIIPAVAGG